MSGTALTSDVVRHVAHAWRVADTEPEVAFAAARKAAEAVCLQLTIDAIEVPLGHVSLADMIAKLARANAIPQRLVLPLKTIQSEGDFAQLADDAPAPDVRATLTALDEVVRWYFTTHLRAAVPPEIAESATTPTPLHVAASAPIAPAMIDLGDALPAAFAARPTALLVTRAAIYVGSDTGEWAQTTFNTASPELLSLPATGPFSAAVLDTGGALTVAAYTATIHQLRGARWAQVSLGAAPLALAATDRGIVAGDLSGGLALLPASTAAARIALQELAAEGPVVELLVLGDVLCVLTASGALAVTAWPHAAPDETSTLVAIDTRAIGRAVALHAGPRAHTAIVVGTTGYATLVATSLTSPTTGGGPYRGPARGPSLASVIDDTDLASQIRGAAPFTGKDRALVYTDGGEAWIADTGLARTARLARLAIAGATPLADGRVLAWTLDGDLHAISADGQHRRIGEDRVVLAAPHATDAARYVAIHWSAGGGTRISRGSLA